MSQAVMTPDAPPQDRPPPARRWRKWWPLRRKSSDRAAHPPLRARFRAWFERKREAAVRAVETPREANQIADQAERKVRQGKLSRAWSDIQVLVRLVRAWARGDYRDVSRGTIVLIVGGLLYFVTPLDAIFDQLPLAGYIDDAAVLAWVISEVRAEIDAFRAWEAKRLAPGATTQTALPPAADPTQSS